jgi:hypothetical protein
MAKDKDRTKVYKDLAKEQKKIREQSEAEDPTTASSTPTMDRLIKMDEDDVMTVEELKKQGFYVEE